MNDQPDWSRVRSPKWILSHLGVLLLITAMAIAGVWQVQRHFERADRNDVIRERAEVEAIPLAAVEVRGLEDPGEELQFTKLSVRGEYVVEDQVLVRNRTLDGAPGFWVLTPMRPAGAPALVVNRGWIPRNADPAEFDPLLGPVEVEVLIQPSRSAEGFQAADPAEGTLDTLGRPDIVRLAQQLDYTTISAFYGQLVETPIRSGLDPVPLPLPELDAGPHASYAAQWFIFTAIALGGYPLVLRRVARGRATSLPDDDEINAVSAAGGQ